MENETVNVEEHFAKEVGKAFILSTAASAGVFAGMVLVGLVASKVQSRRNRQPEKAQEEN